MKRVLVLPVIIFLLSMVLAACGEEASPTLVREYAPRVGYLAPDFELKDNQGSPVKLSDYKGKPVLINFWATWCPPCRAEMPEIEAAYRKYKSQGLVVLGIDAREDNGAVNRYVADGGYSWDMPMDYNGDTIATYGVAAFPTSFFVDREGFIRSTQVGGMDKRGLEDRLAKILQN
jgi:thiol-disulfide isomerase/thioredoxin